MQAAGSSKVPSLQQLLTAPTRMFPRFLWTRLYFRTNSVSLSCQLFDRLQGATGPMKLPVQVHVVVQPAGWDAAQYMLSRAPQQQLSVNHSSSSVPDTAGGPGAGREEVPAAALPTAAAGPGSKPLGPFLSYVSRTKAGQLRLVEIKHNGKLDSYRSISGSPDAHDIVVFEQVDDCTIVLHLQQAPADRSAFWSNGAPVAAGQAMGHQIFPYTHPCVAGQGSTAFILHGSNICLDMPKALIMSQLPELHHDAGAFPLPILLDVFEASQDGSTPALQVIVENIRAKIWGNTRSLVFKVAAPATGAFPALQGRCVLRMALTADHHLGVLMGPAGSYTPTAGGKRCKEQSASTPAPPPAAAGTHHSGSKFSKASAAGAQQPLLLGVAAASGPPAAAPPPAAASFEQSRPNKKRKQQVQTAQEDTAAAGVPAQLDAAHPAAVPAAATAAAPKKKRVKQQQDCAGPFAATAAAAAAEPAQKQKKHKNASAEGGAVAKQKGKEKQLVDSPQVVSGAAAAAAAFDADADAAHQRHKKKKSSKKRQAAASPTDTTAEAAGTEKLQLKHNKKKQQSAAAVANQPKQKQKKQRDKAAEADSTCAADAAELQPRKRKGQQHDIATAEGAAAGSDAVGTAGRKKHRKAAAADDTAGPAAVAAAQSDAAAVQLDTPASGKAAVQQLIQQQMQWVEWQEQWLEKQQRRLARQQRRLASQKAQLQAQLTTPRKRKKQHTAAAPP